MKYLLDTCVVSDFVKGDKSTQLKIRSLKPTDIALSVVTLMEVEFGLELDKARAVKLRPMLADFMDSVHVMDFTRAHALLCGRIRASLQKTGQMIGNFDLLISATALHEDLILVTSNEKEFRRVTGLAVENWRAGI